MDRQGNRLTVRGAKLNAACAATAVMLAGIGVLIPCFASTSDPSQMMRIFGSIAGSMAAGLIVYLIAAPLLARGRSDKGSMTGKGWMIAGGAAVLAASAAFLALRVQETVLTRDLAMKQQWQDLLMLCAGLVGLRSLAQALRGRSLRWLPMAATVVSAACYAFYVYNPNALNASWFTAYHQDAVTGTIYNVSYNTPFTLETSGVYGHYSLFFWPILKLAGRGPVQINAAMAAFGVMAQLATCYSLVKATKNPVLSTAAILATVYIPATLMENVYWQLFPLRHLWPSIILAYCMHVMGSGRRFTVGRLAIAYALCTLGIVWNTDTGLISMVALSGCVAADALTDAPILSGKALAALVKAAIGCAAAVTAFMGVLNVYNLAVGGPVILADCFFPLINGFSDVLQTPLLDIGVSWAPPVVLFVISIVVGVLPLRAFGVSMSETGRRRSLMLFASGLMGLGQCYYYFNRSVAGTKCIAMFAFVCLVLFADAALTAQGEKTQPTLWRGVRRGLGEFCFAELAVLAVMAMIAFPQAATKKMDTLEPATDMRTMEELAEEIRGNFPEDTYIYGPYSQAVYSLLGWDPVYHMRDWPDVYDRRTLEAIWAQWREQEAIILTREEEMPADFDFSWAGDYGICRYYVHGMPVPACLSYAAGITEEQVQACVDPLAGYELDDGHLYTRHVSNFRFDRNAVIQRGLAAELLPVTGLMENYGVRRMDVAIVANGVDVAVFIVTDENKEDPLIASIPAEQMAQALEGNSECPISIRTVIVDADEMFEDEENYEVYTEVLYLGAARQE